MSYLMNYGDDWPPHPPRHPRRSFRQWLVGGKRRHRYGFDRWVVINAAVIVLTGLIVTVVLKLTDHRPELQFVDHHQPPRPTAHAIVPARPDAYRAIPRRS